MFGREKKKEEYECFLRKKKQSILAERKFLKERSINK